MALPATAGIWILAAQLPPVDPPPQPGESESEEAASTRGRMSPWFLKPPGGAAVLTEVVRHQGPVLELATAIRQCTDRSDIEAAWPDASTGDRNSQVHSYDFPSQWLAAACRLICAPDWENEPDSARTVCWTNREIAALTARVRGKKYGAAAAEGWQEGEIVGNGDAIQNPAGKAGSAPLAPSTCEWRVLAVETKQLTLHFGGPSALCLGLGQG